MREYWRFYLTSVSVIILFGALVAPTLEVKMGLGGDSPKATECYLRLTEEGSSDFALLTSNLLPGSAKRLFLKHRKAPALQHRS